MKWADYVYFYAIGHVAVAGPVSALYAQDQLHTVQTALVPDSAREVFQPVYPPQVALIFAPLSYLPYWISGLTWALLTLVAYTLIVWSTGSSTSGTSG